MVSDLGQESCKLGTYNNIIWAHNTDICQMAIGLKTL